METICNNSVGILKQKSCESQWKPRSAQQQFPKLRVRMTISIRKTSRSDMKNAFVFPSENNL